MGSEWIAPIIGVIIAVVTGGIAGLTAIRNTRTGAVEQRAPSATQAWGETDRARARMHTFEDLFYDALGALKHLVRSVRQEHPDFPLTQDVVDALKLEAPDDDPTKN